MSFLDISKVQQAVQAILTHSQKGKREKLIEDTPQYILLQIQLIKPIGRPILKPVRIIIPHSLFSLEHDNSACLFVRSPDLKAIEEQLVKLPNKAVTKVLSLDQVIKLYSAFKDRKKLLSQHTHFLCDERIMSHLYNKLGKVFGGRHNYPVPIDLSATDKINNSIDKAIASTYVHVTGTNLSIRMGHTAMSVEEIVANVVQGLQCAVEKLGHGKFQAGYAAVHSIHIKTNTSAALPLHAKVSSEVMQFMETLYNGDLAVKAEAAAGEKTKKKRAVDEIVVEAVGEVAVKKPKAKKAVTAPAAVVVEELEEVSEAAKKPKKKVGAVKRATRSK